MNHAHIEKNAVTRLGAGWLARLARLGIVTGMLAAGAAMAAPQQDPAPFAQAPERAQRQDAAPPARERAVQDAGPAMDQRAAEAREEERRRIEARVLEQEARSEARRRNGGRLTPDERRDLRRQINEAGVEIYPHRKRR